MLELTPPLACPNESVVQDKLFDLIQHRQDDKAHMVSSASLYIRRMHWGKLLSLYEAYKRVVDLPGSVVELGVFKGESLMFFAKLMELFNANDRSCQVIGFDNFAGFQHFDEEDGAIGNATGKTIGGWSSKDYYEDLLGLINVFDHDRMVGHKPRIKLVSGDINETVPEYVENNPGLRIRLLNLDCDLYQPTLTGLTYLYDKVVPGGIILLDEYGFNEYPGESVAVETFFKDRMPTIHKFPLGSNPGGYIIKGE